MQLEVAAFSRVGGREVNEDAYGAWADRDTGVAIFVLADGAGGHGGGDVASRLVVEAMLNQFRARPLVDEQGVEGAILAAHEAVIAGQAGGARVASMRSTVVAVAIDPAAGLAIWGHVGDSRLYLCRDGQVGVRTVDHTFVQRLIDAGDLTPEEALQHPMRSRLISAIGEDGSHMPVLSGPVALAAGDRLLLCSDGVWEYLDDQTLAATSRADGAPEAWLREIEQIVMSRQRSNADNFTALAVFCRATDPPVEDRTAAVRGANEPGTDGAPA